MSTDHKSVFISYRRSSGSYIARSIFMDLKQNGYDVFMDVESIDSGRFDKIILNQIAARAHFIVILTPGSLDRCSEPGDWLRREIEHAIGLKRNIIPVLANNFTFTGTESLLTGKFSELKRLNGLLLVHDYFEDGMRKLRDRFLKQPVYGTLQDTPMADRKIVEKMVSDVSAKPAPSQKMVEAIEYYNCGSNAFQQNDYTGAILNFTKAISLNPDYSEAFYMRGLTHKSKGDLRTALEDYNRAIDLGNPEPALPYHARGIVRFKLGDINGAISDFKEALRHNPNYLFSLTWLGQAYEKTGDIPKAIESYQTYLDRGGEDRAGVEAAISKLKVRKRFF